MKKRMFCAHGRGAELLRDERDEAMLKRDPERSFVFLEWTVLAAAIVANLLGPHMHGSALLAAIGLVATIAYGVAGLIVARTVSACIATTLGELVAVAALAVLCGRPTYLFNTTRSEQNYTGKGVAVAGVIGGSPADQAGTSTRGRDSKRRWKIRRCAE